MSISSQNKIIKFQHWLNLGTGIIITDNCLLGFSFRNILTVKIVLQAVTKHKFKYFDHYIHFR